MLYIGLGNAGCNLLWHFHDRLLKDADPANLGTLISRAVVADADANNSAIERFHQKGFTRASPPTQVRVWNLDRFWSGGCGVYHIIGELIAQVAIQQDFTTVFGADTMETTLLASAGGGTGGGLSYELGLELRQRPVPGVRLTRIVAILPEIDHPPPLDGAGPPQYQEVHGPDGFLSNSAGRWLVKFLANNVRGTHALPDLFLVSNNCLGQFHNQLEYDDAITGLNRYLANVLLLLPRAAEGGPYAKPNNRLVTFGLGTLRRQPAFTPADLARALLRQALQPLANTLVPGDRAGLSPTGLSALPLPTHRYGPALDAWLAASAPAATLPPDAKGLRLAFGSCQEIHVKLCFRTPALAEELGQSLQGAVMLEVERLFGNNVMLRVRAPLLQQTWQGVHEKLFPLDETGQPADVALLILFRDLFVEDMYRLVNYFAQSSFGWHADHITHVAHRIDLLLRTRGLDVNAAVAGLRDANQPAHLLAPAGTPAEEDYNKRFWGNFDDLLEKVMQNLGVTRAGFNARKLDEKDLAAALVFMNRELFRFAP